MAEVGAERLEADRLRARLASLELEGRAVIEDAKEVETHANPGELEARLVARARRLAAERVAARRRSVQVPSDLHRPPRTVYLASRSRAGRGLGSESRVDRLEAMATALGAKTNLLAIARLRDLTGQAMPQQAPAAAAPAAAGSFPRTLRRNNRVREANAQLVARLKEYTAATDASGDLRRMPSAVADDTDAARAASDALHAAEVLLATLHGRSAPVAATATKALPKPPREHPRPQPTGHARVPAPPAPVAEKEPAPARLRSAPGDASLVVHPPSPRPRVAFGTRTPRATPSGTLPHQALQRRAASAGTGHGVQSDWPRVWAETRADKKDRAREPAPHVVALCCGVAFDGFCCKRHHPDPLVVCCDLHDPLGLTRRLALQHGAPRSGPRGRIRPGRLPVAGPVSGFVPPVHSFSSQRRPVPLAGIDGKGGFTIGGARRRTALAAAEPREPNRILSASDWYPEE